MDGATAEHVREAAPVLEQYCDALGLRCFADGKHLAGDLAEPVLSAFAKVASKPLINMESAVDHPCQALADHKTLDDLEIPTDGRFVLPWAWRPKALPLAVPAAAAEMAARGGMELTILRPEGFGLPRAVMERVRRWGGKVHETDDRRAAMHGAHVRYAKSWTAPSQYGNPVAEARLRKGLCDWCVTEDWFAPARPQAPFLHCLPVRRNVVVAEEVLDGPRSRVVQQAGNRLHVQKTLLQPLLGDWCPRS